MAEPYRCPDTDDRLTVRWSRQGRALLERIYRNRRALGMPCTRGDIIEESLIFNFHSGISDECYNRLNQVREELASRGIVRTRTQLVEQFVWDGCERFSGELIKGEEKTG